MNLTHDNNHTDLFYLILYNIQISILMIKDNNQIQEFARTDLNVNLLTLINYLIVNKDTINLKNRIEDMNLNIFDNFFSDFRVNCYIFNLYAFILVHMDSFFTISLIKVAPKLVVIIHYNNLIKDHDHTNTVIKIVC